MKKRPASNTSAKTDEFVDEFSLSISRIPRKSTPSSPDFKDLKTKIAKLKSKNFQLKLDSSRLAQENTRLKKSLETYKEKSHLEPEIRKYSAFLSKKLPDSPKLESLFIDRIGSIKVFASELNKPKKREESLLITLQLLSDILVQKLTKLQPEDEEEVIIESNTSFISKEESESLLSTINEHSERISKLSEQIASAMNSSKKLLYSPLLRSYNS